MARIVQIIVTAVVLLLQTGCLEPSGETRDPNSGDAQRNVPGNTPPGPSPGPAKPGPDKPDPVTEDPPSPPTWNLALSVIAKKPGEIDVYKDQVRPLLDRSCTTAGCHATPEVIDLRTFPFPFEGSYTMDKVTAQLGADYEPLAAQKIVMKELIEAVETDYMPPGGIDVPLVTPEELNSWKSWLESGLKIVTNEISARIVLSGLDGVKEVCTLSRDLKADLESLSLASDACPGLKTLTYTISGPNNAVLSIGSWTLAELMKTTTARVEFSL